MSNIISFDECKIFKEKDFSMSNGLTDVFIDYLLISGSKIANSISEKRIVVFFAEKQQSIVGIGNVGFDITEIPWEKGTFEGDKQFILKTIEYAKELINTDYVINIFSYETSSESLIKIFNEFINLIEQMSVEYIDENNLYEWIASSDSSDPINIGFPKCEKHEIMLSLYGCKICNDMQQRNN